MDFFIHFSKKLEDILFQLAEEKKVDISSLKSKISVELPKKAEHGDIATNVAMVFCKIFKVSPIVLAQEIKPLLEELKEVEKVDIVNPGFINIFIKNSFWQGLLKEIFEFKENYGKSDIGKSSSVNIEYVSANPTGPLHIGHGRGAVIGSALANLYRFLGYKVIEEYWINDLGNQIDALGRSLYFRYLELFGKENKITLGENFYPGEYLIDTAKKLKEQVGDKWVDKEEELWLSFMRLYALEEMLQDIKEDLKTIDVVQDVFSSEKEVGNDEAYQDLMKKLAKEDLVYRGILNPPKGKVIEDFEPREQKLFRSSNYGDDTDRPLEKSNGEKTYFATDVVYHNQKVERGFTKLINVFGADHIGYIKRIQAVVSAVSKEQVELEVVVCQMVNILKEGKPFRMSKRAGNFITLKDVVEDIGKDAFRFMMFTRKNDVKFDLDVSLLKEQNADNPVFYIQYAYARTFSVLENAKDIFQYDIKDLQEANFALLDSKAELDLIKSIVRLPASLKGALYNNDLHRIYLYLLEVSRSFHYLWNKGKEDNSQRFILKDNKELTFARLSLLYASAKVLKIALDILGIEIKEHM